MDIKLNEESRAIIELMIADGIISHEDAEKYFPELKESEDERIRKILIESFEKMNCSKVDELVGNQITSGDILAWLEKQGEQKTTLPVWKYKKDDTPLLRDSFILNKYGRVAKSPSGSIVSDVWVLDFDALAKLPKEEFEKQGSQNLANSEKTCKDEQTSTDKVESKFEVGDWITNGIDVDKIIGIDLEDENYLFENGGKSDISLVESISHIWTIQDAKDGDVLATDCFIFIFKNIDNSNGVHYYCHYEICKHENDVQFGIALPQSLMGRVGNSISHYSPATKEQRDLLFQKMKETGYEWDAEKKKLRKVEQKPAWSEEDERLFQIVIDILDRQNHLGNISHTDLIACVRKLKSLKERYTWKPSDEQMIALDDFIYAKYPNIERHEAAVKSLYQDLKKLTE